MNVEIHHPSKALSPYVARYTIVDCPDEMVNRVLPEASMVMAIRYKGLVKQQFSDTSQDLPVAMVSGLRKSGRTIQYLKDSGNILIVFNAAGASAFFREPLHALAEESVPLDSFQGYQHAELLHEQLASAKHNTERVQLVEQFLLSKLFRHKPDPLVFAALDRIRAARGVINMKGLADAMCLSQDAFEKRFRKTVGISPKQYSFIIRMKAIINQGLQQQTLAETAFHAGYFDQPHFTKDFKLFTGQTPTDYLKAPVRW
ncbi:helix-turn-helix domain-containing protein [Chryseolinea lacunae]|uniref:AraC family transcriptional regulator n=1 Tax=Chryseolinea lacunae TaxID=2801331 RepID=A0ABS1KNK1_9BACT|nr:helix-turn-helix domain-containing protein [Chryseolinea lacunae]MBL0740817.1 AraC family transcriptional regulator [Chryseolinea lacunae]